MADDAFWVVVGEICVQVINVLFAPTCTAPG